MSACAPPAPAAVYTCVVSFDLQGGEGNAERRTVTYGEKYGGLPAPSRYGHTFDGWYFTPEGYGKKVVSGNIVKYVSDHTLYAVWTANEYTVSFDLRGGTGVAKPKTVDYGGKYGFLPSSVTAGAGESAGKIFAGWETGDGEPVTGATVVEAAEDRTLYAVWWGYTVTVLNNFDANNTTGIAYVSGSRPSGWATAPQPGVSSVANSGTDAGRVKGTRAIRAVLYKDGVTKPRALKIGRAAFGALSSGDFTGIYSLSLDINYFYTGSGQYTSNLESTTVSVVMYSSGGKSVTLGTLGLSDGWQTFTQKLNIVPHAVLSDVQTIALEFDNEGTRYTVYIDDLRVTELIAA